MKSVTINLKQIWKILISWKFQLWLISADFRKKLKMHEKELIFKDFKECKCYNC